MQTYDDLVALGELWQWDPDGMQLAKAERFNLNTQTVFAQVLIALQEAKQYCDDAVAPKSNSATSIAGYNIADAYTKEEVDTAVSNAINAIINMAPAELDTLKEIADKIALSDSDIQAILGALSGKAALSQVYTRDVLDTKLDVKADKASTLAGYAIADAYTKTQSDASLALKADKSVTYTKVETDSYMSDKLGKFETAVSASKLSTARTINVTGDVTGSFVFDGSADISMSATVINDSHSHAFSAITAKPTTVAGYAITDAYTKAQNDASLALKADKSVTYTKVETDSRIQAVIGAAPAALDTLQEIAAQLANDESAVSALTGIVATKADTSNVYTKTEIDGKFNQYADADLSVLAV